MYDPELTLSTDDAEADLLRFFFLDPPAPILDWPAASRTLVPSIIFAPSVVMAAMLSSPWRELKKVKSLQCEKWQKHWWHDSFQGIGKLWFNIKWTSLSVLWWKHSIKTVKYCTIRLIVIKSRLLLPKVLRGFNSHANTKLSRAYDTVNMLYPPHPDIRTLSLTLTCGHQVPGVSAGPVLAAPGAPGRLASLGVLPPLRAVLLVVICTKSTSRWPLHPDTGSGLGIHD